MKFLLLLLPFLLQAITFKVATYNVENLFDIKFSGNEYVEYIPGGRYGWSRYLYQKKLSNISKVIYDLHPDIIALEEIESKEALLDLQKYIKKRGLDLKYYAIADKKNTTVKVALLSRFPIKKSKDIKVSYSSKYRDILEVWLEIDKKKLLIFVNHWKSKTVSESERIKSAKALKRRLSHLSKSVEYIVLGDFNSNYNEYITFLNDRKLNNTKGKTGINHILGTIYDGRLATYKDVVANCNLLYNLWLELPKSKRYSYIYSAQKNTIDNILLPCSMLDNKGIRYIKNSFGVFKTNYLFKNGSIYRWQKKGGYGKFTGDGFSDHLPIYAYFSTNSNYKKFAKKSEDSYNVVNISSLYKPKIKLPVIIKDAVVIYKDRGGTIVKRINDRAIYIYKMNKFFKKGYRYDIVVSKLNIYKGNLEITKIKDATRKDRVKNIKKYYLHYSRGINLLDKKYINDVIYKIKGRYDRGYLNYHKGEKIRIYNMIRNFFIKNGSYITLKKARIVDYKGENELILYYKRQIR